MSRGGRGAAGGREGGRSPAGKGERGGGGGQLAEAGLRPLRRRGGRLGSVRRMAPWGRQEGTVAY